MRGYASLFYLPPPLQLTTSFDIILAVATKSKKRLCNEDCNNCEAITNPQVALLLNVLALQFGDAVWQIANEICPNLTCCPICHIDDFCHDCADAKNGIAAIDVIGQDNESCEVAMRAVRIFNKLKKKNDNGIVSNRYLIEKQRAQTQEL